MSNDLISRSAVINLIESKCTDGCLGNGDITLIDAYDLLDDVSELPTAYDVDKVVGEMQEKMNNKLNVAKDYEEVGNFEMAEIYSERASEYRRAIEIVKAGGVNE